MGTQLVLPLLLGACSGSAKAPEEKSDMKAMPSMPANSDSSRGDTGQSVSVGTSPSTITLTAAQVQHGRIAWAPAAAGTVAATATLPGQVVPNEDRTARLGAPASGRVTAVRVSPGDRVAPGSVLVTLQSPEAGVAQSDLAKATAALAAAQAQEAYARSARERAERLLALKAIPRQDYERAIADEALAQATLSQAEAELRRARSTSMQLGSGASGSGEIALRSPIDGVVLARTAVPGTVVEMGAPLVVVTDPASLWLTVNAPEALIGAFRKGTSLRFSVAAFPNELFVARVDAVGAGLDPETRTLPVRAVIVSGIGRLKPEMLASVSAQGTGSATAVMVPDSAVQMIDGKTTVFLARPTAGGGVQVTPRVVDVGSRAGGQTAITSGLQPGDVIVTGGAFSVKAQLQKGSMPGMEM